MVLVVVVVAIAATSSTTVVSSSHNPLFGATITIDENVFSMLLIKENVVRVFGVVGVVALVLAVMVVVVVVLLLVVGVVISVTVVAAAVIGQVRSECLTCAFRASCCSARLSRAQVPWSGEKGRGDCLHWWVQGSTSSPTGVGSRRRVYECFGIWNVP